MVVADAELVQGALRPRRPGWPRSGDTPAGSAGERPKPGRSIAMTSYSAASSPSPAATRCGIRPGRAAAPAVHRCRPGARAAVNRRVDGCLVRVVSRSTRMSGDSLGSVMVRARPPVPRHPSRRSVRGSERSARAGQQPRRRCGSPRLPTPASSMEQRGMTATGYSLSALTRRSMSSSTVPDFGSPARPAVGQLGLGQPLVRLPGLLLGLLGGGPLGALGLAFLLLLRPLRPARPARSRPPRPSRPG